MGSLGAAVSVNSLASWVFDGLKAQLLYEVDYGDVTDHFRVPDRHEQVTIPKELLNGLVILLAAVS